MYSVLIVDDELAIRQGLATLIDWNLYGFQVVDTAANAIEAKQKYEQYSPDLMIVDIRMPGKNGLELIEELRAEGSDIHIIILSGYADFSYAKRALTLGTDGYLLKPVDEDELQVYLVKLAEDLEERMSSRQKNAEVLEWSKERLIHSALMDMNQQDQSDLEQEVIEAGLHWKSYEVVLIRLTPPELIDNGHTTAIKERLSKQLEETNSGFIFSIDSYMGVLTKPTYQMELARKTLYQNVEEAVHVHGLQFIIAAGDRVDSFDKLSTSYNTALMRIKDHFFYDESQIIGPESKNLKSLYPKIFNDMETALDSISDRIYLALDIGNTDLLDSLIQETGQIMVSAEFSEMAIRTRFSRIVAYVLTKLSNQYPKLEMNQSILGEQMQRFYEHTSLPVLQRYVTQILHYYGKGIIHDDMEQLIQKMTDLIHRNYFENLKLEVLADVFNYNSAYLGKLFKSITGDSFNTYLDKVRMNKAKEKLDMGVKIHQAAMEVGFCDVDYFREKFKKYEGISPSVYRKNK
ncbi:response regulator transcription factor [Paenibacillus wynnii]|uniref:response regulator transcription factor n=1 Tax=Paenibacillus wynnii TaxID=268407 RepID=UPI00278E639D|nr:response regulator transcription factor [Paenibacillus wynnii]MDQ0192130.1 two-component system response regulator YesN [Paenibacillus wynnii]